MKLILLLLRHEVQMLVRSPAVIGNLLLGILALLLLFLARIDPNSDGGTLATQFVLLLLLVAAGTPIHLAIHALVGEKERRTLEALLLLPMSVRVLVFGKLSVVLVITQLLLGGIVLATFTALQARGSNELFLEVFGMGTLYVLGVVAPLLTVLFSLVAVIISGRARSTQSATNLNLLVAGPLLLLLLGTWVGWIVLTDEVLVGATLLLLIACSAVLPLAIRVLQPEALVAR